MRLGVFGKIGLAFGVLLLAFAGYATFTLLSVHRARQGVVANEAYLELQGAVDAAWKSVNDFAPSLGRAGDRLDPNLPLALRTAQHAAVRSGTTAICGQSFQWTNRGWPAGPLRAGAE